MLKAIIIILTLFQFALANDTTSVSFVKKKISAVKSVKGMTVDLKAFRKFLDKTEGAGYKEIVIDDVTGDGKKDSIINTARLNNKTCRMSVRIISGKSIIYQAEAEFSEDDVLSENIWGSDSVYYTLFPYSLLYNSFLARVTACKMDKAELNEKILLPLSWKEDELKEKGLDENNIQAELKKYKDYIYNYKGKFINSLSPSDPDTYIYDKVLNKFIVFYAP